MSLCTRCKNLLSISDFSLLSNNLIPKTCKNCRVKKAKFAESARNKSREFVYNHLLSHHCVDCGEENPLVLTFDHVKGKKKFAISDGISKSYSIKAISAEMEKCLVRCANCHMKKTSRDMSWWKEYRMSQAFY